MRIFEVYCHKILAGILTETDQRNYIFEYEKNYFLQNKMPAISLTLPKNQQKYEQKNVIFAFFSGLIAEGDNLDWQANYHKIDKNDTLSFVEKTAEIDTTGAVTLKRIV